MLSARNIIYGKCKTTTPPKYKYLISLYRSPDLNIIAVFPTSQPRAGCPQPQHGPNRRHDDIVSYVFEAGRVIGYGPDQKTPFRFPRQTTIPFDYCFKEASQEVLVNSFIEPKVVGVLSIGEYIDLLYAFVRSSRTPRRYATVFEQILQGLLSC